MHPLSGTLAALVLASSADLAVAGPFTLTGNSSAGSTDSTYRTSTRPSLDQATMVSEAFDVASLARVVAAEDGRVEWSIVAAEDCRAAAAVRSLTSEERSTVVSEVRVEASAVGFVEF